MRGVSRVSRRQFSLGTGAVIAATTVPWPARASVGMPPMKMLAERDPRLAQMVRELAKRARFFKHLTDRYFLDDRYSTRWTDHYWPIIKKADAIYARIGRPQTQEERDVLSWLEAIAESDTAMARTPWHPVPDLSNRGRWLEAMLEEALIRRAEARIAFSWISRNGWCNPCYPAHAGIIKAFDDAHMAIIVASRRIRVELMPRTPGDLQLLQRAWQIRLYAPRCFEVKYYPKVRARHASAGIVGVRLSPQPDEPERRFRFFVPEDSPSDGRRIKAARASARRVNLSVKAS